MAFYHDFLYGDTIETPALPTKSRAQPPRACNNRPVIYYNNADKTFYDKPQQAKRRTTIKQSMLVKQEGAKGFEFDGRPVEDCCRGRVWFDLFETIYFTMDKDNRNVAVNLSFTNNGHLTRLIAAGKPLPYSQEERKLLTSAGLVLPDRRAIVDTQAIVDIDDELDANQLHSPSYASDSTDEEDNGRRVREVQTPAKKPPRTPAKPPPAVKKSSSPHVGIPPSPCS